MVIGNLFTAEQINNKVKELVDRVSADYEGKIFLLLEYWKGASMFYSDLVRMIKFLSQLTL